MGGRGKKIKDSEFESNLEYIRPCLKKRLIFFELFPAALERKSNHTQNTNSKIRNRSNFRGQEISNGETYKKITKGKLTYEILAFREREHAIDLYISKYHFPLLLDTPLFFLSNS